MTSFEQLNFIKFSFFFAGINIFRPRFSFNHCMYFSAENGGRS